jgi:simple sugar transport system substrate-binding protein
LPNLATYSGRFYEGRYIQGQIAAKMSKKGVLGYIGSFPIPEVVSGMNATMIGAQSVNPDIKVKIIWVNSWFDPGKEADAAKALADQGADVLMQHTDSPAAMQIAAQRGILAFGQDSDMIKFGPKSQLTSIVDNWTPYYVERTKAVLDGTWKSGDVWGGLASKLVMMAPFTNMPDEVKKMAEATEAAIITGKLHPFKCPVIDQSGKTVECKGGTHLADEQILSMNYFVKGVDEKLPGK